MQIAGGARGQAPAVDFAVTGPDLLGGVDLQAKAAEPHPARRIDAERRQHTGLLERSTDRLEDRGMLDRVQPHMAVLEPGRRDGVEGGVHLDREGIGQIPDRLPAGGGQGCQGEAVHLQGAQHLIAAPDPCRQVVLAHVQALGVAFLERRNEGSQGFAADVVGDLTAVFLEPGQAIVVGHRQGEVTLAFQHGHVRNDRHLGQPDRNGVKQAPTNRVRPPPSQPCYKIRSAKASRLRRI